MKSFKQFLKENYELEKEGYTQDAWDKLDSATKSQYLKDHPDSKYNPNNIHNKGVTYKQKFTYHLSKIYDTIVSKEPKITEDLENITKNMNGARLEGLAFKIKSPESLARKIKSKIKESKKKKLLPESLMKETYDIIRYTQVSNINNLIDNCRNTVKSLTKAGYKIVEIKNFFNMDTDYKGINVKMRDPNGAKFEFQFNTPKNMIVKEEMHKYYEILREPEKHTKRELRDAEVASYRLAHQYEIPKNAQINIK